MPGSRSTTTSTTGRARCCARTHASSADCGLSSARAADSSVDDIHQTCAGGSRLSDTFDLIVVGGGPAGENAVGRCAGGGLSVALVEKELIGGECSYWGCIPSK